MGDEDDDLGEIPEAAGLPEENAEERRAAKKGFFPSSMGLSFLVSSKASTVSVLVRWGDYVRDEVEREGEDGKPFPVWQRIPREQVIKFELKGSPVPEIRNIPESNGLQLFLVERTVTAEDLREHIPDGTRSVSVFLVNRRTPLEVDPDSAYAFQPALEVHSDAPFVPRPDPRGILAEDWDEQVADLHYADDPEYAAGHGVSAEWEIVDGDCRLLRTAWIPSAEVEKTKTETIEGVELSMDALGGVGRRGLGPGGTIASR